LIVAVIIIVAPIIVIVIIPPIVVIIVLRVDGVTIVRAGWPSIFVLRRDLLR
jgi:hypothetical protein